MLYDPRWKKNDLSLAGLIAWLETKPPDEEYNFTCSQGCCLIAQYMRAQGVKWDYPAGYTEAIGKIAQGPWQNFSVANQFPWTFGAALERARKMQHRIHRRRL